MTRVKVWATSENPLGEGNLVGYVPLVEAFEAIYMTADTQILLEKYTFNVVALAARFGIEPPPLDKLPEMAQKMAGKFSNAITPKIVLDSGEVVYGCQVWWDEI